MLLHYRAGFHHNDFEDIHIYHHVYDRLATIPCAPESNVQL